MRAVAKIAPREGALQVIDVPEPQAAPGMVVVRPVGGGVCGTDVSLFHWYSGVAAQYDPSFPLIMGHELAGVVEAVGSGVTRARPGQLVAINPHVNCGACFFCNSGRHSLCDNRRVMGCHIDGGWAERVAAVERNVHVLPAGSDPTVTPLLEPMSVAVHAVVERAALQPGESALVMGAGTIGLLHLLVARACGAGPVFVTGLDADRGRLALAEELGGIPVNLDAQKLDAVVRGIAPRGADAAFDTTGSAHALHPALASLRKGGRLALVGINHGATEFDTLPAVMDEQDLLGCRAYTRNTWLTSVALLPGLAASLRRLITHVLPFSEAEQAIGLIERRECIKVVLQPDA